MGALWLLIYNNNTSEPITKLFIDKFMKTSKRGPTYTEIVTKSSIDIHKNTSIQSQAKNTLSKHNYIKYKRQHMLHGYHRLSINDSTLDASQPFSNTTTNLMCNGEIYNYTDLITNYSLTGLTSNSDTEVILPLYNTTDISTVLQQARGEFSFIITENINTFVLTNTKVYAGCDFIGTKPMYLTYNTTQGLYMISTELKNIPKHIMSNSIYTIKKIPSGMYYDWNTSKTDFTSYFDFDTYSSLGTLTHTLKTPDALSSLYTTIVSTIKTSIIEKFTFGDLGYSSILLSGGFDSSLIASVVLEYLDANAKLGLLDNVYFLTVSDCPTSDDITCAKSLITYLESKYNVTLQHKIVYISSTSVVTKSLNDIVYITETANPTTIVNSTYYYFLYTFIKQFNIKSLLSGDGLDEYFTEHADLQTFQDNSITALKNLHSNTLAKTDKVAGNFGIEVRFVYLDFNVFDLILNIHPSIRKSIYFSTTELPVDKYIIRKAFETYLPSDILWRAQNDINQCTTSLETQLITHYDTIYTQDQLASYISTYTTVENTLGMYLHKTFCDLFHNCVVNL